MLRIAYNANVCHGCFALVFIFNFAALTYGVPLGTRTSWHPVDAEAAELQLFAWMDSVHLNSSERAKVIRAWNAPEQSTDTDASLLDRLAVSLTAVEPRIEELIAHCSDPQATFSAQSFAWLHRDTVPPFIRDNMCLYYARWLVQQKMFDEALAWTEDISPAAVVDPSALLFFRAVSFHQLVQVQDAHVTLAQIMEHEDQLPRRYYQLAVLMQKDLEPVREDTLDHIARRMADIRRRLTLGQAGQPVQQVENGVIETLDKLIKQIEDQQNAQSSQQSSPRGQPSGTPMQDSRLAEMKAQGKVHHRDIGDTSGWGDLPPREREQALQQIGREFPAHYREIIEAYFRALASDENSGASQPSQEP